MGPCVQAAAAQGQLVVDDVLDEPQWQLYSQAAAATGVRSSMSLPIPQAGDAPAGALNLYASDPCAFEGVQAQLAELFGVHVNDLVANADLSFMTRDFARELPQRLDDHEQLNQAAGMLMSLHAWDAEHARERIRHAATRAGVTPADVAAILMLVGS